MVAVGKERNECARVLQNVLFDAPPVHTSDVKVPARWMWLHLELSRLSPDGLLELSTCIEVADWIVMGNDLPNALDYFTKVALHMRFPDKLPKLVFAIVNPIVSRLSTVLATTFSKSFISCVLPLDDPNPQDYETILLIWDNKVLPQVFLPALIVH